MSKNTILSFNFPMPVVNQKQSNFEEKAAMGKNKTNKINALARLARKSIVSYQPRHAKLGDDDLQYIKVSVPKSSIKGMTEEEAREFIVEQFPEHEWGHSSCWDDIDGSFSVSMDEANYYAGIIRRVNTDELAKRVRKSAVITVYGDVDVPDEDKQLALKVEVNANDALELMDGKEFLKLVVGQFPEYDWGSRWCGLEGEDLLVVKLSTWAAMDNFFDDSQCMSVIKTSSMKSMHLDLVGYQRLAKLVKQNAFAACRKRDIITINLSQQLLELFSEAELSTFIAEQFPGYFVHVNTPKKDVEQFSVKLLKNEQTELTD